jgi:hypothetical protein
LHNLARDALNAISAADPQAELEIHLENWFPWRQYLAFHAQASEIVGTGITRATAEFIRGTNDPNRRDRARMDFIVDRTDGTWCRFHPGTSKRNDAKLIFSWTQSQGTAQPHLPFTYATAMAVPQQDRVGKRDAFRLLKNTPCGTLDWQWWLFVSNVGSLTRELIGPGIVQAELHDKWDTGVELLFRRVDATEARLQLTECRSGTYQTRLL